MKAIGLIRCEKNEEGCPLTGCFKSLRAGDNGYAVHGEEELVLQGVMTCRCPGEDAPAKAKVLKAKGAQAIHFATCTFAGKQDGAWTLGLGFCQDIEDIAHRVASETGLPCVLGSAHLPAGYKTVVFGDEDADQD
ncbi:MAG: CGGC domain-containing protein [Desulfovibrionaceae bacterium]